MEEKVRFVLEYERDEQTMSGLCERFGIARETGYVWLRRYRAQGLEGLLELKRAAKRHPNQTAAEIEQAVLELRQAHMRWGPRKLKRVLERDESGGAWPAASTIGEMIKRAGLVVARKKRRKTAPYTEPLAHADGCNRVWCADFKGWFRSGDGERIDPLTISDAYSRYLLRCQAVEKTDTERVRAIFEAAFREYGMPQAMRTDNGTPFASAAIAGLSRLAVWWIKLGIVPERIEAGHPEQNGRQERMHRTLKQESGDACRPKTGVRNSGRWMAFGKSTTRCARTRHWAWKRPPVCMDRRYASILRGYRSRSIPAPCWYAACSTRGIFAGRSTRCFSAKCSGRKGSGCCRSTIAGLRSTLPSCPLPALTATNCGLWHGANPKASTWTRQGKGRFPLPLHLFPSTLNRRKCQGCARSKMSGMFEGARLLQAAEKVL